MTLFMKFFVWFRLAALSDYGERIIMNMDLSIFISRLSAKATNAP